MPAGLSINPQTGVISGIVAPGADGASPYNVTISAEDGIYASTQTFTWNVSPTALAAPADQTNLEGATVSLALVGKDATGALTYSANNLPAGLAINAATGLIYGTVTVGDVADSPYSVTVTATDPTGNQVVSQTFNWTINPVVTLANPGGQSNATLDVVSVSLSAGDADSATLTYTATGLPTGLSINSSTGAITGTIGSGADTGSPYTVTVTATDTDSNTATQTFIWQVGQVYLANPGIQNNGDEDSVSWSVSAHGNNGYTLSYSATGLPAGLSLDSSTGQITGTISSGDDSSSPYTAVVTVSDGHGGSASQTFTWNVSTLELTNPGNQTNSDGDSPTLVLSAGGPSGDVLTFGATGLPEGLYLNTSTGYITGDITPQADLFSLYRVTVNVSDNAGHEASQSFAWTVDPIVTITDPGNESSVEDNAVSLSLSMAYTGSGTPAFSAVNLPPGLSINSSTGAITGSPSASSAGVYNTVIDASDGTYAAQIQFAWTVTPHIAITVPTTPNNAIGDTVSVAVSATDVGSLTVSYSATGLPTGLSIDSSTGVISGTISGSVGTYPVEVTASNGTDSDTATFYWQVCQLVISNPGTQINMKEDSVSLAVTGHESGSPTLTYSATGLPTGLSINATTGVISGTASTPGTWTAMVKVSDGTNSASQSFAWVVTGPVFLANPGSQSGTDGDAVYLPLVAEDPEGASVSFSESGLPSGLSLNSTTGVISGTVGSSADASSPYSVTVIAAAGSYSVSQTFTWTVGRLLLTNPGLQSGIESKAITALQLADAASSSDTVTFSASGLPSGLSIDSSTGLISGTPAAGSAGTYTVTATATDSSTSSSQTFTWFIAPDVLLDYVSTQNNVDGDTVSLPTFAVAASGNAVTYSISGSAPDGVSIDSSTGVISGTINDTDDYGSPYSTTLTATDGSYSASETFTWVVAAVGLANPGFQASSAGASVTPLDISGRGSGTLSYSATGLPSGLSIDSSTGVISGTISSTADADSPYDPTITVGNGSASASVDFVWVVNPRLTLYSPGDQSSTDGGVVSLQVISSDGDGSSVTYSASGLPAGLSINSSTGLISGTISSGDDTSSPYTVDLSATDGTATATQSITWTVSAPTVTVAVPGTTFNLPGDTPSVPITASDGNSSDTFTFSATGLPSGLSINSSTGTISGTVGSGAATGSPYSVTITATASSDSISGSASFVWIVGAFTLAYPGPQQSLGGSSPSLQLSTANAGSSSLTYSASGLPTGLSINSSTGLISGTISSGAISSSPYSVTVGVTNGTSTSSQTFTWTVVGIELTNPGDQSSNDSQPVLLLSLAAVDADDEPISYSQTGLPTGLTIDSGDGLISGTIGSTDDTTGTYSVSVTATDGSYSATQSFSWTISTPPTLTISGPGKQSNLEGDLVSLPVSAADPFGSPLTFSETGLPTGLTINPTDGVISGTVGSSAAGSSPYSATITATDGLGNTASTTFTWTVAALAFYAPGGQLNALSVPVSLDLSQDVAALPGTTLTYSNTGLPTGLSLDSSTGLVTGTPNTAGNYLVKITVSDGTHSATGSFTWQISSVSIAAPGDQTNSEGDPVSVQLAGIAAGQVTYVAANLPAGLTLNGQTGVISGTLSAGDAANSPYFVDIAAISGGNAASQSFLWTVNPKISVTAIDDQTSTEGTAVGLQVSASETGVTAFTFSADNLPAGLSINSSTGLITGTILTGDALNGPDYFVTVKVTDGTYSASVYFWWTVEFATAPGNPSVQSIGNQSSVVGQTVSLSVNATDSPGFYLDYDAFGLPDGLVHRSVHRHHRRHCRG